MKKREHAEKHFEAPELIRDIVIGMSDGLTVPFALAAGLSGSVSSTNLVVIAGMAEIAAGSIAMGLGGYLAARTDREHYLNELERERREIIEVPEREKEETAVALKEWGLPPEVIKPAVEAISKDPNRWVDFMMKYELGLEEPDPKRARNSSLTIGLSYIVGGLVPLLPYVFVRQATAALLVSVVVTLIALFAFGFVKGKFTGSKPWKSAAQTTLVGGSFPYCQIDFLKQCVSCWLARKRMGVKTFAQYVTARLRQEDPGLPPSTVYVLQLQSTVDVRKPQDQSLILPDRIVLNGQPYQVDAVDDVKYPNMIHVQLSEDLR
jgi:VIT1/CCC1 family predicted Fe2+/Mn2+ transporter